MEFTGKQQNDKIEEWCPKEFESIPVPSFHKIYYCLFNNSHLYAQVYQSDFNLLNSQSILSNKQEQIPNVWHTYFI
jgi:hypothetical protein